MITHVILQQDPINLFMMNRKILESYPKEIVKNIYLQGLKRWVTKRSQTLIDLCQVQECLILTEPAEHCSLNILLNLHELNAENGITESFFQS